MTNYVENVDIGSMMNGSFRVIYVFNVGGTVSTMHGVNEGVCTVMISWVGSVRESLGPASTHLRPI